MVWLPTVRLDVEKLAVVVPAVVLSVPWPMLVLPSVKMTTPVGLAGQEPLTVAVKVTFWPQTAGLVEATTAVVLLEVAVPTVWVKAPELARKLLSPP